jgi:hypothetical protein
LIPIKNEGWVVSWLVGTLQMVLAKRVARRAIADQED